MGQAGRTALRPRRGRPGLISNIHEIWEASGHTYGADRVHRQLRRDGIRVGRKRVERLMADQGWQGAFLRRGWRGGSTKQDPRHTPAPDLVNRQFTAARPNRLWVADATRIPYGKGVFWLAAVRDALTALSCLKGCAVRTYWNILWLIDLCAP
ncbi:IS3 family transposase [Micromonospora cremea]|uniref:HTH-like domain-containing protein n=1 Tax=Micromonospora cremea TaxID=709881 RepID=A0A1N5U1Q4_9ACTN|nr:IS3 family transposase [Micromonospora cremea]SIM54257.1 HTH-like domain-containing protein [Micromonospora cremea]